MGGRGQTAGTAGEAFGQWWFHCFYFLFTLAVGDEIRISFIRKTDPVLMGKLVSFGVSPGKRIKIRQKFPAYVIQIENTQIALEQDIAAGIYGLKV